MIQTFQSTERRAELSDFLRSRRARLSPADVGLADGARRRTPGLRREEVALLANIGSTWYTRLEQGVPINVSAQVLDSIARALRLSHVEREHLFVLAGQPVPERGEQNAEVVSPLIRRMLKALEPNPAYVRGRRWDLLAFNRAAAVVFGYEDLPEGSHHNVLWRFFMEPASRARCIEWEVMARRMVATFRSVAARYPDDESFRSLINALQAGNEDFRRFWGEHDVCDVTEGLKRFYHPQVGELILDHTQLFVPDFPDMRLIVSSPEPGSESERKLHSLMRMHEPALSV